MPRIMTITMEVNDDEAASLLARFAERGVTTVSGDTPTPAAANGSDTDANVVVWDARYHASTRNTNQDGSWKALRGMDDATKAAAAVYEASFANPAPAPAPAEPEPETESDETIPAFLQKPADAAPAAPALPTMLVAAPVAAPVSFEELSAGFQTVIEKIGTPALMEKLGAIYEAAGVDSAGTSLTTNETQRAQVLAALKAL